MSFTPHTCEHDILRYSLGGVLDMAKRSGDLVYLFETCLKPHPRILLSSAFVGSRRLIRESEGRELLADRRDDREKLLNANLEMSDG